MEAVAQMVEQSASAGAHVGSGPAKQSSCLGNLPEYDATLWVPKSRPRVLASSEVALQLDVSRRQASLSSARGT
jgi:hypothetical protein